MRKQITYNRNANRKYLNHEYYLALQLYLINKKENKRVPRLPASDFRRYVANQKVNKQQKYYRHFYFPSFSEFIKKLGFLNKEKKIFQMLSIRNLISRIE